MRRDDRAAARFLGVDPGVLAKARHLAATHDLATLTARVKADRAAGATGPDAIAWGVAQTLRRQLERKRT